MKKIISLMLVVIALSLLVSCSNGDEVADEIVHYYNEEWVPINDMKEKGMRGLPMEMNELAESHKNGEVIALIKDEMLPIFNEVLDRLKSVDPKNREIKKLNDFTSVALI